MRLLSVELARFWSRRAIVLLTVAALLLTALVAVTTIWSTRPLTDQEQARAERLSQAEADRPYLRRELARCESDPAAVLGPGARPEDCALLLPGREWQPRRPVLSLERENSSSGMTVIVILSMLMSVVGATFAGADWSSGSVSNQVLFEPRRARLWLGKAAAVLVGTLVATTVILTAFWISMYLAAESRGVPTGASVQEDIRWTAARGIVLAAGFAVAAYALTMLLRHTVGTLGVLFAYAIGGELLIATLPYLGLSRLSMANNVTAWLEGGSWYYDSSVVCGPGAPATCDPARFLSLGGAAAFLAALVLAVAALSLVLFRRRDIP